MEDAKILRSRMTLLDQLSVMEPKNIGDLLGVRDEVDASVIGADTRRVSTGVVTLASILEAEKNGVRTLLDIIREEDEALRSTLEAGGSDHTLPEGEERPAFRVSLITLLELADRMEREDMVTTGCGEVIELSVAKVESGEEATESVTVAEERILCCVCMARKKGAAFIPCGHTFCRTCSRELLTSRGSCPLCNVLIFDILDIF